MLELAEAGDWAAYVNGFYGEAHKFRSPADRDALVERFEQRLGHEGHGGAGACASGVTPTIAGGRATFVENGQPLFELHEHDGRWTFHL